MSVYDADDDVKKLIYKQLGCSDWTVGKDEEENPGQQELSTLTIEELDDEDEEKDEEVPEIHEVASGNVEAHEGALNRT